MNLKLLLRRGRARRQPREIRAIKDGLANQRRDIKVLFDQFSALTARLSVLQEDTTTILRNTAELAEQVRATQTQMAQDNAKAVEQLKAVAQQARDHASAIAQTKDGHEQVDGVANGSEESPEFRPPLPRPRPDSGYRRQAKTCEAVADQIAAVGVSRACVLSPEDRTARPSKSTISSLANGHHRIRKRSKRAAGV